MSKLTKQSVLKISENVVARKIGDDFIMIPISSGIGNFEDELYSLNETAITIWEKVNGSNTVEQIADLLKDEFDDSSSQIEDDVLGFLTELVNRKIMIIVQ